MTRDEIAQAVARGWCHPRNALKQIDSELALAITDQVWDALNPPNLGCATTGELLAELRARADVDGTLGYRTVGHELPPGIGPRTETAASRVDG